MWNVFTNLGDAAITLPVAAICAGWIALFDVRLALRLVGIIAVGTALVGATKVVYAGWGISIPADDFRVISGHTMLSTCVWMVAITLLLKWWRQPTFPGIVAGLVVGALTGFARLVDQSHSLPEVISGWILGACVGLFFLRAGVDVERERFSAIWPTLSILVVSTLAYGHKAPFEYLIETRSPQIRSHVPSVMAVLERISYRVQSHDATSVR